jgi:class 3 adenylate cyclase/TolB-like protein/thioredoxin-like negative regulator of GroEL
MDEVDEDRPAERRLAAIWFADVPGFTRLSAENEPEALRLLSVLQAMASEIVEDHGGTVVKFMGDGVLAEFPSTDPAAEAVLRLQMGLEDETRTWDSGPHLLRAGLHLGDVTVGPDGDIFGDGVNRASRLEGLAEPGQLLVSEDVWRQLRRRPDFQFADGGEHDVRNVPERMQVYALRPTAELAQALGARVTKPKPAITSKQARPPRRSHKRAIAVGVSAGLIAFISLIVWSAFEPPGRESHAHDGILRVAVIPFAVRGEDATSNAYLGEGVADEMIHALRGVDSIRVSSRRSSFAYGESSSQASSLTTMEIAAKLGVNILVVGSVRPAGSGNITLTAEALTADHDEQVGDGTWTGPAEDITLGQELVVRELVGELIESYDMDMTGATGTPSVVQEIPPAASEALQRGRHALAGGRYRKAVTQLEAAATLAPLAPRIKLALAEAVIQVADAGEVSAEVAGARAKALLMEAAALEDDPNTHALLGYVLARFDWDWVGAEEHYREALAIQPTTTLRREYAEFLASRGRFAPAQEQIATSILEEPGSVQGVTARGIVFFRAGELDQARVLLDMALQLDPTDLPARIHLARSQAGMGAFQSADSTLASSQEPLARAWRLQLRIASGSGGIPARRIRQLDEALRRGGDAPYVAAAIHLAAGRGGPMKEALLRAIEVRSPSLMWLASDPIWESARGNVRFQEVVSRVEGS